VRARVFLAIAELATVLVQPWRYFLENGAYCGLERWLAMTFILV
jgi:hypothetical protein